MNRTDTRERMLAFWRALPLAQRLGAGVAVVALVMLGVVFVGWVTTPSYTVLYSGLDDATVSSVIGELETRGVPYELESGGSTVLVPREALYETRADLAAAGLGADVGGSGDKPGWELLDDQGLSVSDQRQRVDYQRALEGELARTLEAMDGVTDATVHLVLPEEQLFAEQREPASASVLLASSRELRADEVETVAFLTASAVEGLGPDQVTIAGAGGQVLHAPGDAAGPAGTTNRNLRQTREFEQSLAGDVTRLLSASGAGDASVVVRATLNYDQVETEAERFDPENQVVTREQTQNEEYEGAEVPGQGVVGVDGGPLPEAAADGGAYQREEVLREYGVDRVVEVTRGAPGRVDRLSVAVLMDDGTATGVEPLPAAEVERLVTAALGLDPERGDEVAVTAAAFPAQDEAEEAPEVAAAAWTDLLPQAVGALVILVVVVTLLLMTRRRKPETVEVEAGEPVVVQVPDPQPLQVTDGPDRAEDERSAALAAQAAETARLRAGVTEMVQRQPEEIAMLLRGWLADRRQ